MINDTPGITLVTNDQNPLQAMLLAPYTIFEDGHTIYRKRSDQNITMHMAVSICDDLESLPKIMPVLYRFDGRMNGDFGINRLTIESHWYSPEYDRGRGLHEW